MKNILLLRIILDIILFVSALLGAWWLVFLAGIFCVWYFKRFVEFPLAAFAFDVVYAAPRERIFGLELFYSLIALVIFAILIFLKSKVRKDLWQKSF